MATSCRRHWRTSRETSLVGLDSSGRTFGDHEPVLDRVWAEEAERSVPTVRVILGEFVWKRCLEVGRYGTQRQNARLDPVLLPTARSYAF